MNTRKTLALAIVLGLLCAGYYGVVWYEKHRIVEEAAAKRLFDFEAEDLASMRLERSDGTTIEAVRTDGAWDITKPFDHIVPNANVWRRIANAWATLSNERTFGERELADYGLDNPILTVTGTPQGGEPTTIAFGSTEPLQIGRYAYHESIGVFLVQETVFREFDRPLNELRQLHLVQVGEEGVTQLAFAFLREAEDGEPLEPGLKPVEQSTTVRVQKSGDTWTLKEPLEFPADQQAVEALAQGLQFATAKTFVDQPESYEDYGLDPPRGILTAWSGEDGEAQTIYLGDADASTAQGAVWAKKHGNPSVFQIGGELLALLPTEPETFRERRLLTRELEGLKELELLYNGGAIRLVNDPESGWLMVEPFAEDTDQTQVSSYLAVLKNAKGSEFPDITAGEAGLIAPVYTIRLHYADETREIRIGAQAAQDPLPQHYVQLDFGAVSVFSDILRNALVREPFDFRNKNLMQFKTENAKRLHLALDHREYVLEKKLNQWHVTSPANAVLESQSDIQALLKTLAEAKAVAVQVPADEAGSADLAAYELTNPVFAAEIVLADENDQEQRIGPLHIGGVSEASSQERYVRTEGRPEIFRAKQALLDSIRDALRGIRVPAAQAG